MTSMTCGLQRVFLNSQLFLALFVYYLWTYLHLIERLYFHIIDLLISLSVKELFYLYNFAVHIHDF